MQTSARNQLAGRIVSLKIGPINAEVIADLGVSGSITALITKSSADSLGLVEGSEVVALVKASSIIVVPGSERIKLSARNQLSGKVVSCRKGAVNAEVSIQLAGGEVITAIITNTSLDKLALQEGDSAYAVFKASGVIIGIQL
jgi:molybdate transport system regulatory protein